MKRSVILGFLIIWILSACANQAPPPVPDQMVDDPTIEDVTVTPVVTQTVTATPYLEARPTATDLPIVQTPTAVVVDPMKWQFQDLFIQDQPVESLQLEGSVVLQSEYYDDSPSRAYYSQIHIWDLENGDKRVLAPEGMSVETALVSPGRNWIAYEISKGRPTVVKDLEAFRQEERLLYPFILEDQDGEEFTGIFDQVGRSYFVEWANDNDMIIGRSNEGTHERLAFNPFSGALQPLPEDPNDMYLFGWHLTWLTVYDPSLTFRLYLNDSYEIALENMTTGEVVGAYPGSSTKPQWLPHEPIFLARLPGKDKDGWDLYSISIDGDQRKVVDVVSNLTRGGITRVEVSPDGKKVAFWVTKDLYYGGLRLGVVDLETLETTIYNLTSVIRLHEPGIVWSPDGTKLLVEVITVEEQQVFLADLEAGWAVKIADDMSPIGWLK
jgi:hypothetical protein